MLNIVTKCKYTAVVPECFDIWVVKILSQSELDDHERNKRLLYKTISLH